MPIDFFSYDGDAGSGVAPRRPTTDDLGGDELVDFPPPPNPTNAIVADAENQRNKVLVGHAKTQSPLILSIIFSSGTPSISKSTYVRSSSVTFDAPTDNGPGDTTITWPADSFPPSLAEPEVSINGSAPGMASVEAVANGVRVRTLDSAGSAADLPFTVRIT